MLSPRCLAPLFPLGKTITLGRPQTAASGQVKALGQE